MPRSKENKSRETKKKKRAIIFSEKGLYIYIDHRYNKNRFGLAGEQAENVGSGGRSALEVL
ncbi:hypothetical protein B5F07_06110 [Lachnoclostridium sp. An169]|nr:hypothetical protein B5F07_06110 [Lachnoclostridium sp. An169]